MLDEAFLSRLSAEFPSFYDKVSADAMARAARLRAAAGGDVQKALVRARFEGAAQLWWPYVRGSVPLLHQDRAAMEGFSSLVLTVDHIVGYVPPSMEAAREQVVGVLRSSLDYERIRTLLGSEEKDAGKAAAAGAGLVASASALMAPITTFRQARRFLRVLPGPARIALGGVVLAALASVPVIASYSAGRQAERSARNYGETGKDAAKGVPDLTRAA